MNYATKNLMLTLAIVYGVGAIGLHLRAPEYIQTHLSISQAK